MNKKKILSLFLALVMVLGMLPTSAMAFTVEDPVVVYDYNEDGVFTEGVDAKNEYTEGTLITLPGYHDRVEYEECNAAFSNAKANGQEYIIMHWRLNDENNSSATLGGTLEVNEDMVITPYGELKADHPMVDITLSPGSYNDVPAGGNYYILNDVYAGTVIAPTYLPETVGITAPDVDGVQFECWRSETTGNVWLKDMEQWEIPGQSIVMEAMWTLKTFTVTYDYDGEDYDIKEIYPEGTVITLPGYHDIEEWEEHNAALTAAKDDGKQYYVADWNLGGWVKLGASVTVDRDLTITPDAYEKDEVVNVTFKPGSFDGVAATGEDVTWPIYATSWIASPPTAESLGFTAPEVDGIQFRCWQNVNSQYDTLTPGGQEGWTVSSSGEYVAVWTKAVSITLMDATGGSTIISDIDGEPIYAGDSIDLSQYISGDAVNGQYQTGWYQDKNSNSQYDEGELFYTKGQYEDAVITNDITLYPVMETPITITLSYADGTSKDVTTVSPWSDELIYAGDTVDLGAHISEEEYEGYYQTGWYKDENDNKQYDSGEEVYTDAITEFVASENVTLYPIMKKGVKVTLIYDDGGTFEIKDDGYGNPLFPGDEIYLGSYIDEEQTGGLVQSGWYLDKNNNKTYETGEEYFLLKYYNTIIVYEDITLRALMEEPVVISYSDTVGEAVYSATGYVISGVETVLPEPESVFEDYSVDTLYPDMIFVGWKDEESGTVYGSGEYHTITDRLNLTPVYGAGNLPNVYLYGQYFFSEGGWVDVIASNVENITNYQWQWSTDMEQWTELPVMSWYSNRPSVRVYDGEGEPSYNSIYVGENELIYVRILVWNGNPDEDSPRMVSNVATVALDPYGSSYTDSDEDISFGSAYVNRDFEVRGEAHRRWNYAQDGTFTWYRSVNGGSWEELTDVNGASSFYQNFSEECTVSYRFEAKYEYNGQLYNIASGVYSVDVVAPIVVIQDLPSERQTLKPGQSVTLTVQAENVDSYQWYINEYDGSGWKLLSGEMRDSYTYTAGDTDKEIELYCILKNLSTGEEVSSQATPVAVKTKVSYTVTYRMERDGEIIDTVQVPFETIGDRVDYTVADEPEKEGYSFRYWEIYGSGLGSCYAGDIVKIYEDTEFVAIWDKKPIISFDAGDVEVSNSMDSISVISGWIDAPECTFIPPEGKIFLYWYSKDSSGEVSESPIYAQGTIYCGSDITLIAQWGDVCTVSFSSGDVENVQGSMDSVKVAKGYYCVLPDCGYSHEDKYFTGYMDGNGAVYQPNENYWPEVDSQLVAQWADYLSVSFKRDINAETVYTLNKFKLYDGFRLPGLVEDEGCAVDMNTVAQALGMDASSIIGWKLGDEGSTEENQLSNYDLGGNAYVGDNLIAIPITGSEEKLSLTISSGAAGLSEKTYSVSPGTNLVLRDPSQNGMGLFELAENSFDFKGWNYNGSDYVDGGELSIIVNEDTRVTALWYPYVTITLKGDPDKDYAEGVVDEWSFPYRTEQDYRLTSPGPDFNLEGYTLIGYKSSEDGQLYPLENMYYITSDVTFTAVYTDDDSSLRFYFDAANENIVFYEPASQVIWKQGETYIMPRVLIYSADPSLSFAGWELYTSSDYSERLDDKLYLEDDKFSPGEGLRDVYAKATWVNKYTVSFYDIYGSPVHDAITVTGGENVTLPDFEKEGYRFLGWEYADALYPAGYECTVTENMAFYVSWKQLATVHFNFVLPANAPVVKATLSFTNLDEYGRPWAGKILRITDSAENTRSVTTNAEGCASVELDIKNGLSYIFSQLEGSLSYSLTLPEGFTWYGNTEISNELYFSEGDYINETYPLEYYAEYTVTYDAGDDWDNTKPNNKVFTVNNRESAAYMPLWPGFVQGVGVGGNLDWYDDNGNQLDEEDPANGFLTGPVNNNIGVNADGEHFLAWEMITTDANGDTVIDTVYPGTHVSFSADTTFKALWGTEEESKVTVRVIPGYIYPENAQQESYVTEELIPVTHDKNGELYEEHEYEFRVGEYFAIPMPYTVPPAEDAAMVASEYKIYRDGKNVGTYSGTEIETISGIATGNMVAYPLYNYRMEVTLLTTGPNTSYVIEDHYSGRMIDLDNQQYYYPGEYDGKIHTGWYVDYNNDGVYQTVYDSPYTHAGSERIYEGDKLLYDRFTQNSSFPGITKYLLADVNNTIKSLWSDGYVVEFRDVISSDETYSHYEYRLDSGDDHSISIDEAGAYFYGQLGWNREGLVFTDWTLDVDAQSYAAGASYDNSAKASLVFTANWEQAPYTLSITDSATQNSYTGTGDDNEISIYTLDSDYSADIYCLVADSEGTLPKISGTDQDYFWHWTVQPMVSGEVDEYAEVREITYSSSIAVSALTAGLIDQGYTEFKVSLNVFDGGDGVDKSGTASLVLKLLNESSSEDESFALVIHADDFQAYYTGFDGNSLNLPRDKNTYFYHQYKGNMPDKDPNTVGVQYYDAKWTISPLNEEGGFILGSDGVPISFNLSCEEPANWDGGKMRNLNILNQVSQEYAEHSKWRLTLSLIDPEDSENISGGIDNTGYFASLIITYVSVKLDAAYDDGTEADLFSTFRKTDNVTFTPSTCPEDNGMAGWAWRVYGSNDQYETITADTLSISDIRNIDGEELYWTVYVRPVDSEGYDYGEYGSYAFNVNFTNYDYIADIGVYLDEQPVDRPGSGIYSFKRDDAASFVPSLDREAQELASWRWDISGADNNGLYSLVADELSISDVCQLDEMEENWLITLTAFNADNEPISSSDSVQINSLYEGPLYTTITASNSRFTGTDNYQLNRNFVEWYYCDSKGIPTDFADSFLPYWTIVPLGADLQPLEEAIEVFPNVNWGDSIWKGWVASGEVNEVWENSGYGCDSQKLWRLTLGVKDAEGNVYDAENTTGYMASLVFDISNPLALCIRAEDGSYSGDDNVITVERDTRLYQSKDGEDVEGYTLAFWTAQPLDEDGMPIADAPVVNVIPDSQRWEWEYDDDEGYEYTPGYITGEMIQSAAGEAYASHDRWLVTLAMADSANQVYPNGKAVVDVSFGSGQLEEYYYSAYIENADKPGSSYSGVEDVYYIGSGAESKALKLIAHFAVNGMSYSDSISFKWTVQPDSDVDPLVVENAVEYDFSSIFTSYPDVEGFTIYLEACDAGNPDMSATAAMRVELTSNVAINYPLYTELVRLTAGHPGGITVDAVNATAYQWYKVSEESYPSYQLIPGATEATLSIDAVSYSDTGEYLCIVTGYIDNVETQLPAADEDGYRGVHYNVEVMADMTVPETVQIQNGQATLSISVKPEVEGYTYQWFPYNPDTGEVGTAINEEPVAESSFILENAAQYAGMLFECDVYYNGVGVGTSSRITILAEEPEPEEPGYVIIEATDSSGNTINYTSLDGHAAYIYVQGGETYSFKAYYAGADGSIEEKPYEATHVAYIDGEPQEDNHSVEGIGEYNFGSITLPEKQGETPLLYEVSYMVAVDDETWVSLSLNYIITEAINLSVSLVDPDNSTQKLWMGDSITVASDTTQKLVANLVKDGNILTAPEDTIEWKIDEELASSEIASGNELYLAKLMELEGDSFEISVEITDYDTGVWYAFRQTVNRGSSGSVEPEPEPEESGVSFTVNGQPFAHGATATVEPGDVSVSAAGYGLAKDYAITYMLDGSPVESVENGVFTISCADGDSHTITATAVNPVATLSLYDEATGNYTATLYLKVSGTQAVTGGGTVDVDPSDADDDNNPTAINVTGILKDDVTTIEDLVYSVEIVWGNMAFEYHTTDTEAGKTWNAETHSWEANGTPSSSASEWKLYSSEALSLPDKGTVFTNADQSYAAVYNHSNDAVDVDMAITMYDSGSGITVSLTNVTGGVQGTASATGTGLEYQLARGVVDNVYHANTGAAAKVSLADKATNGLSEDPNAPTKVAKLSITISKPSA